MSFGIGTFVDGITGAGPSGPTTQGAPGASSRTQGMAPRSAAENVLHGAMGMAVRTPGELGIHQKEIDRAAAKADQIRRSGGPIDGSSARLAELALQVAPHVQAVATYVAKRQGDSATADTQAHSLDPFVHGAAVRSQEATAANADTEAQGDLHVLVSLDTFTEIALDFAERAAGTPRAAQLWAALAVVGTSAAPLGWSLPSSRAEARARSLAHEPCPEDADAVNPEPCPLDPHKREAMRRAILSRLETIGGMFAAECDARAAVLQAAIDRDQEIAELIAKEIVEAIIDLATGGVGGKVATTIGAKAATAAAAKGGKVAADALSEAVHEFRTDLARSILKTAVKDGHKFAEDAPDVDSRNKTTDFLGQMKRAFGEAAMGFPQHLVGLDDDALMTLDRAVEGTNRPRIGARLDRIVAAYRDQIEPIGQTSTGLGWPSFRRTVTQAARLHPPGDGAPRLALVKYTSDTNPELRKAGRAFLGGASEGVRQLRGPRLFDDVERANEMRYINKPEDEIEFVRWIDSPTADDAVDLHTIADSSAIDLPIDRVRGLSFVDSIGAW